MSPFSERLRALRLRYGVRQKDLAEAMGFEQSYVSALELGIKGPPSRDFVDRLAKYLRLSADELADLLSELEASRRHYTIPQTASSDAYRLCGELWRELDLLSDAQIRVMRELIETWRRGTVKLGDRPVLGRVIRKDKEGAEM